MLVGHSGISNDRLARMAWLERPLGHRSNRDLLAPVRRYFEDAPSNLAACDEIFCAGRALSCHPPGDPQRRRGLQPRQRASRL